MKPKSEVKERTSSKDGSVQCTGYIDDPSHTHTENVNTSLSCALSAVFATYVCIRRKAKFRFMVNVVQFWCLCIIYKVK